MDIGVNGDDLDHDSRYRPILFGHDQTQECPLRPMAKPDVVIRHIVSGKLDSNCVICFAIQTNSEHVYGLFLVVPHRLLADVQHVWLANHRQLRARGNNQRVGRTSTRLADHTRYCILRI